MVVLCTELGRRQRKDRGLKDASKRSVEMLSTIRHAIHRVRHRGVSDAYSDVWIFVLGITLAITLLSVLPS